MSEIEKHKRIIKKAYQAIRDSDKAIAELKQKALKERGVSYYKYKDGLIKVLGTHENGSVHYLVVGKGYEGDILFAVEPEYESSGYVNNFIESLGDELTQDEFFDCIMKLLRDALDE